MKCCELFWGKGAIWFPLSTGLYELEDRLHEWKVMYAEADSTNVPVEQLGSVEFSLHEMYSSI